MFRFDWDLRKCYLVCLSLIKFQQLPPCHVACCLAFSLQANNFNCNCNWLNFKISIKCMLHKLNYQFNISTGMQLCIYGLCNFKLITTSNRFTFGIMNNTSEWLFNILITLCIYLIEILKDIGMGELWIGL